MRIAYASAVAAAVVLAACGGSESKTTMSRPRVISRASDEEQIRAVFAAYQDAVERGDGKTICKDVLAPSQVGELGESVEECAHGFNQMLKRRASQRHARVHLGEIKIGGNGAIAETATGRGFVEFHREDGRWGLILFR
jgi:ketosteroid isomerase-like protein